MFKLFFSPRQPSSPSHSHRLLWLGLIKATKIITKFNHSHSSVFFFVCLWLNFAFVYVVSIDLRDLIYLCFVLGYENMDYFQNLALSYRLSIQLVSCCHQWFAEGSKCENLSNLTTNLWKNIFLNFSYSLGFLRSLKNSLTLS